ncbi:MAG: hypothetical protein NT052_01375 [Candidatus Shapirobacteria bacterium]|nr:hypothetical protein [Candidatus Shapirobacteria bacterium]
MGEELFFLTDEVVTEAMQRTIKMIEGFKNVDDYSSGDGYCITFIGKDLIISDGMRDVGKFSSLSRKKAEMAKREKKDLIDFIPNNPTRLRKGDNIFIGGIYSSQIKVAIGVAGFIEEVDDAIARHFLTEIKMICRIKYGEMVPKLKREGIFYLKK